MKVLSPDRMREVDRRTVELGIPSLVLMENAGHRVLEAMAARFSPLASHCILVLCGKGNNGGDGLVVARQLHTRIRPRLLWVVLAVPPDELSGDAADTLLMLQATGCPVLTALTPEMQSATLIVDAILGTGLRGAATGPAAEFIEAVNDGFPDAKVVAVDLPSGMNAAGAFSDGPVLRADLTVTFTAPKLCHALPPNCDLLGELVVSPIGGPGYLMDEIPVNLIEPRQVARLFGPRPHGAHKGDFGHVLVAGGAPGKNGAAGMAGIAALRAGAGLVTIASPDPAFRAPVPELMSAPWSGLDQTAASKTVLVVGPGLGQEPADAEAARMLVSRTRLPVLIDADGLNVLSPWRLPPSDAIRILTPHPGEMSRLIARPTAEILDDRLSVASTFAQNWGVVLILKGQRTLIAFPDGSLWINPTGSPAMAKAGSGDILSGLIAGAIAQDPGEPELAILAAVYLHGRCGELGAARHGERHLLATELLDFLPEATRELEAL